MAFEIDPLFYERLSHSLVLLMSFFLFLTILDVEDMEKREYCYNYIASSGCYCNFDTEQLLNKSVKIANIRDVAKDDPFLKIKEKENQYLVK